MSESSRHQTLSAHFEALAGWDVHRIRRAQPASVETGERSLANQAAGTSSALTSSESDPDAGDATAAASPPAASAAAGELAAVAAVLAGCAEEVAGCTLCALHEGRTQTVFGVGNPHARLMLVGEAPGRDEDLQGEPFVGRAGQLLDRIIAALGLQRDDVYIANVLKCRPPNNRDPQPDEVRRCTPYLSRQIEAVAPEMIVALGRPASHHLLGTDESLARLRGRLHSYQGIPVVATYHPAYLLRNPGDKAKVWQDLQVVIRDLGLPGPRQHR